jgi:hypothetical protein
MTQTADIPVPPHRPWATRVDAVDVEIRYRRSVHYWRRRGWRCGHATAPPSTFGLDIEQLRAHGRELYAAGWTVTEICTVLDIDPVRTS